MLEGRPEVARDRLEPWLDRPGQQEADVTAILPFLAWAYLELGDQARAEAVRVRGLVATRAGRYDEAEEALEQAIALGERMPYPHTVAKVRYAFGLLCQSAGGPGAAREQLEAAQAICLRLGEGLFRPATEAALRRLQDG